MNDRAHGAPSSLLTQAIMMRERGDPLRQDGKVVQLPVVTSDGAAATFQPLTQERDWAGAVELVKEASEAIRIAEERNGELEAGLAAVLSEATTEIEALRTKLGAATTQLDLAQARIQQAETRAANAEKRAVETEAWLCKLHDTVVKAFSPIIGRDAAPDEQERLRPSGIAR
jgi:hypothetical protein